MRLFSRFLAAWIPIRAAADRAVPRFAKVMEAGLAEGPPAVNTVKLEAAIAGRDFPAAEAACGPGIAAMEKALYRDLPGELMRILVAGADAESESPIRQLIVSAPGKVAIRFDASNPAAVQWAKTRGAELVREVTKSQRETIRTVLIKAAQENTPVRQTAALLKGVLPLDSRRAAAVQRVFETKGSSAAAREVARLTKQRALVIARTETMRASNEGQRRLWEQRIAAGNLPKTMQRVWITTPDDRLCPVCAPLDGTRAPIDGQFPSGLSGPPAHPQCRCAQGLVSAVKPMGPELGLGTQEPVSSPSAAKPKTPARKVMDSAGLPNLSVAPPTPGAGNQDPDWNIVTDFDKAHAAISTIHTLREELQTKYNVFLATPGFNADTVAGRMEISQVLTAARLVKSSKDVLVKAGLLTDAMSMPFELKFTKNPTQGAAFMFADTAYTSGGGVLTQKIVVNLSSPAMVNVTALKSVLKVNQDAGWLAGKSPESIFTHEMGHLAQANTAHGAAMQKAASAFWEDPAKKLIAGKVSKYAASKPSEFVAEVFSGMAEGVQFDPSVLSLYADLGGKFPVKSGEPIKSGLAASSISQKPAPPLTKPPAKAQQPIPSGPEGDIIHKVLELRAQGLSYNAIEKAMGWPPQKGFKAFAIVKKWGATPNAAAESPTAAPVAGPGTGASVAKPVAAPPSTTDQPTVDDPSNGVGAAKANALFNKVVAGNKFQLSQDAVFKPITSADVVSHKKKFKATLDALEQKFYAQGYKLISEKPLGGADLQLVWEGPGGTIEITTKAVKVEFAPAMGSQWNNQSQYQINVKKIADTPLAPTSLPSSPKKGFFTPAEIAAIEAATPKPPPAFSSQPAPSFFDDLLKNKIAGAKGSNPGGVYKTNIGEQYYVKQYANPAQGHGENLANAIYGKVGFKTPESVTGVDSTGKQLYASKWMTGLKGTAKQLGYDSNQARKFMNGFLADVLTANWDAAGTGVDNFGFLEDGTIARLDQGGSFLYRAQAGLKPKELLNKVTEWDSFFGKNAYYAEVAAKAGVKKAEDLGGEELNFQLNKLKMLVPDWKKKADWRKLVDDLGGAMSESDRNDIAEMLHTRMKLIDEKVANAAGIPAKPVPAAAKAKPVFDQDELAPDDGLDDSLDGSPVTTPWQAPNVAPSQFAPGIESGPVPQGLLPKLPLTTKKNPTSYVSASNEALIKELTAKGYDTKAIAAHTGITSASVKSVVDAGGGTGIKLGTPATSTAPSGPQKSALITPDKPYGNVVITKDSFGDEITKVAPGPGVQFTTIVTKHQLSIIKKGAAAGQALDQIGGNLPPGWSVPGGVIDQIAKQMGFAPLKEKQALKVVFGDIPTDSRARAEMPRPPYEEDIVAKYHTPYTNALGTEARNLLTRYTGSYYSTVNGYLRGGGEMGKGANGKNAEVIQRALVNAPSPPPPTLVYRTQGLPKFVEDAMQPGAQMVFDGFLSSTVKSDLNFGGGKALFEIIPKRGAWVEPVSSFRREKEFLLPHGQEYRILKVTHVGGKVVIRMEML